MDDNKSTAACIVSVSCSFLSWLMASLEQHAAIYSLFFAFIALMIQIITAATKEVRERRKEKREDLLTQATIEAMKHGQITEIRNGS